MKIIINDKTNRLGPQTVMNLVSQVIDAGQISEGKFGKQYCYLTIFQIRLLEDLVPVVLDIAVAVRKRASGTQTFTLYVESER